MVSAFGSKKNRPHRNIVRALTRFRGDIRGLPPVKFTDRAEGVGSSAMSTSGRPHFLTHVWSRLLVDFARIALAVLGGPFLVLIILVGGNSCSDGVAGSKAEVVGYVADCTDGWIPGTSTSLTTVDAELVVHVEWLGLDHSDWKVFRKGESFSTSVYTVEYFPAARSPQPATRGPQSHSLRQGYLALPSFGRRVPTGLAKEHSTCIASTSEETCAARRIRTSDLRIRS